jgi:hypothetical protein
MAQTMLRKQPATRAPFGNAKDASWDNGIDLHLRGYWLNPNTKIQVEIPVLPHAFEPTLTQTDTEIKRNIEYRSITLPPLSVLRAHGLEVERAAVITEVLVDDKHIRNYNFFRGDFPAMVKGIARRDNVLLIFPATDMPSARLKRKKVLGLWRLIFAPLFLGGKHYYSGRLGMFMAGPPEVLRRYRTAFNLHTEEKEADRQSLMEWHPAVDRVRPPRKRGPRPAYTREQQRISAEVIAEASMRLKQDLFPILSDKIELDKTSSEARELEAWLGTPSTSRELLRRTEKGGKGAIRTWVNQVLVPKVKEIVKDEASIAAESLGRWIIRQMLGASLAVIIDSLQQTKMAQAEKPGFFGRTVQKLNYSPGADPFVVGSTAMNYRQERSKIAREGDLGKIMRYVQQLYAMKTGDYAADISQVFNVTVDPRSTVLLKISLAKKHMAQMVQMTPETLGKFADKNKLNLPYCQYIERSIIPQIESETAQWYRSSAEDIY